MRTFVLFLSLLLSPALALAATTSQVSTDASGRKVATFRNTASTSTLNLLEAVAMNGAAATRTITLPLSPGFEKLRTVLVYTFNSGTAVTASLSCSIDGTNYGVLQSRSCASGTCTDYTLTDSKAISAASVTYMLEYDVRGCSSVKIVYAVTGAAAADTLSVQAVAVGG